MIRPPGTWTEILEAFGDINQFIRGDGTIRPEWERRVLAACELPQPLPLSWDHTRLVSKIRCHVALVPVFERAFRAVDEAGLWAHLVDYGGCYAFRQQRGGSRLSLHAFGAAADFDVAHNQLGEPPRMHPGVIQCFESAGFFWGGRWRRPDGMHFEFTRGRV